MLKILTEACQKFFKDEGTFLARGLAFGLLFYCIPLALLSVSALSYTVVRSDTALGLIRRLSFSLVPQSSETFDAILASVVAKRGAFGLFGFVAFVFASSATFGSVRLVLNRIFGGMESRGLVHGKLMEIAMMAGTSMLFFIMIAIINIINFAHSIAANFGFGTYLHPWIVTALWTLGIVLTFALFWFLYRFAPSKTLSSRGLFVASFCATCLFQISKWAFGEYLGYTHNRTPTYGALSAVLFFFIWLYYASLIFVFAAEIGWVFDRAIYRRELSRLLQEKLEQEHL